MKSFSGWIRVELVAEVRGNDEELQLVAEVRGDDEEFLGLG